MPAVILLSILLFGCSGNTEVARTDNTTQAPTTSNNNNAPVNNNVNVLVNNNVAPNQSNASTPLVSNASAPTLNQNKKSAPTVNQPSAQIGSGGGDMFLFTQVRGALGSDKELLNAVIVEIKEGNATLTGSVSSEAQKTKAAQLVQSVNGIKSVKNNLRVSS